ncbi:polyprenyl synthetase family protein [Kitasatospora sp. NPDC059571]|uniref:polyprenyl synthetase family protein n=1 Tax=Kitasatospora sp. NPDC059571 TaxID=3346871 RepID=UPI0036B7F60B
MSTDHSKRDALAVATGKTAAPLSRASKLGALAVGANAERAAHLRAFGLHLGIALQCTDDLLRVWGDERVTSRPAAPTCTAAR